MITIELIKTIIQDWFDQDKILTRPRLVTLLESSNEIVTVIGPRRSGKTFLLFNRINQLIEQGIKKENIIYINFEDERLFYMNITELDLIIQSVRELRPDTNLKDVYFFFDEIQNINNWEKFVRRIDDTITKNIYITGSNSKLLSSEIATSLRGRTLKTEIYPLNFNEFLSFEDISYNINSSASKAKLFNELKHYLQIGGFPRIVMNNDNYQRTQILQEYYNVMIQRDIMERYNLKNILSLKFFCNQIINNHAGIVSINKIYNSAKSAQIKVSLETFYEYFEYLQNIYLIGILKKYNNSIKVRDATEKKVYLIDNGMYNAVNQSPNKNTGKLLEASIYHHLIQKYNNDDISFYKGEDFECDFVIHKKGEKIIAIQATVEMIEDSTKKREINGLIKTCKLFQLKEGIIITINTQDEITVDGIKISVIPAWKYLLIN